MVRFHSFLWRVVFHHINVPQAFSSTRLFMGLLSSFQILAIAMNLRVHIFFQISGLGVFRYTYSQNWNRWVAMHFFLIFCPLGPSGCSTVSNATMAAGEICFTFQRCFNHYENSMLPTSTSFSSALLSSRNSIPTPIY